MLALKDKVAQFNRRKTHTMRVVKARKPDPFGSWLRFIAHARGFGRPDLDHGAEHFPVEGESRDGRRPPVEAPHQSHADYDAGAGCLLHDSQVLLSRGGEGLLD